VKTVATESAGRGAEFAVLLIEDEPIIRELVESVLGEANVRVRTAPSGLEGLKLAQSERFDLILVDVVMPELDGISVCRVLKSEPGTRNTPLYMLTAKTAQADIDDATRAGADGYIQKPFRGAELLEVVNRIRQR
jgi:CheY-like chemotaxis protein